MRDFDVEAVHAVVFDAQVVDAGARLLAGFEIDQELSGVVAQCSQLVELGIEAGATTSPSRTGVGRLGDHATCQKKLQAFRNCQLLAQR